MLTNSESKYCEGKDKNLNAKKQLEWVFIL